MFDLREINNWFWGGFPSPNTTSPMDYETAKVALSGAKLIKFDPAKIVKVTNITASTDLKVIHIPIFYLNYEFVKMFAANSVYKDLFDNDILTEKNKLQIIVSIYNTFFLHEWGHIKWTETIPNDTPKYGSIAFNIIEDIYINNKFVSGGYSEFFKIPYSLFYTNNVVDMNSRLQEKLEADNISPVDYVDFFLNRFLIYNFECALYGFNNGFEFDLPLPDSFFDGETVVSVPEETIVLRDRVVNGINMITSMKFNNRVDLQKLIVKFIESIPKSNKDSDFLKQMYGESLNTSNFDYRNFGERTINGQEESKELNDSISKIMRENNTMFSELSDMFDEFVEELVYENIKRVKKQAIESTLAKSIKVLDFDISAYARPIEPTEEMKRFAEYIRFQWGVKRNSVKPNITGSKLSGRNLHRIATDGRIFKKGRESERDLNRTNSIFLVDFSGSMHYIINKVLRDVVGISESLQAINYPHSIWGHTTRDGVQHPILFNIFSYGMPDINNKIVYDTDVELMVATAKEKVDLRGNEDYIAIETVTKYFGNYGKNNLFVLSDGVPSPERGGTIGIDATKMAIDRVRKNSTNVFSLSLVEEVVEDNNRIYGNKNNFEAYDTKLTLALQRIAEQLAQNK